MVTTDAFASGEAGESSVSIGRGKVVSLPHPSLVIVSRSPPFPVRVSDFFARAEDTTIIIGWEHRRQRLLFSLSPLAFSRQTEY